MSDNPYAATAIYEDVSAPGESTGQFYVVSSRKLTILYLATMGFYGFYWFYKQWARYRDAHAFSPDAEKIWPVPRAIFSVFYAHSLFRRIKALGADNPVVAAWGNTGHAWLWVVVTLISSGLSRASYKSIGSPVTDILSLVITVVFVFLLIRVQHIVNLASGDPEGSANRTLTGANWAWIVAGIIFWLLALVGLLVPEDAFA